MTPAAEWAACPLCGRKTKLKLRPDTVLKNFPMYCPKCRREAIVDAEGTRITKVVPTT